MNRETVQLEASTQHRKQINYDLLSLQEEHEKLENSYFQEDLTHQQELATLRAVQVNQDLKLQKLESNIKKCEKNLSAQLPHFTELETEALKHKKKLAKIGEDTQRMISVSEKKIRVLKELKNEAEEELRAMKEEENKHNLMMVSKEKEMEDALEKLKKKKKEKFEDAETLYKSKELTLLGKTKCVNMKIEALEKDLEDKKKELKELKRCYIDLQSKYNHRAMI